MKLLPTALVALAAAIWAGALGAAPLAASMATRETAVFAAAWMYRAGAIICHQQEGRSFLVEGHQLPVCARCTGLYAGAAAGATMVVAWSLWRRRRRFTAAVVPLTRFRWFAVACGLPTLVAWAAEHGAGLNVPNAARFALALPLGAVIATIVALWAGGARFEDSPAATAIH